MSSERELGSKEARVAEWRNLLEGKSENELIHEMNSYIESSERHIAAKQLLTALREAKENERHQQVLAKSSQANRLSLAAIIISVIALAITAAQFFLKAQ